MNFDAFNVLFSYSFCTCGIHVLTFCYAHRCRDCNTSVAMIPTIFSLSFLKNFLTMRLSPFVILVDVKRQNMHSYHAHPQANLNTFHLLIFVLFFPFSSPFSSSLHDLLYQNENIFFVCRL